MGSGTDWDKLSHESQERASLKSGFRLVTKVTAETVTEASR